MKYKRRNIFIKEELNDVSSVTSGGQMNFRISNIPGNSVYIKNKYNCMQGANKILLHKFMTFSPIKISS